MASEPLPVSVELPSPRSPTLSDAGMILPEADSLRSYSPDLYIERPPSPPSLYSHSNRSTHTIKLAPAPQAWREPSPFRSPPLSSYSSRSTLRNLSDSGARSPGRMNDHLASSPTIQDALSSHPPNGWGSQHHRDSSSTSSLDSEDLDKMKWAGFAEEAPIDDSGVALDEDQDEKQEEIEQDQAPIDVKENYDAKSKRWTDEQSEGEEDEDMYSSAAL